MANKTLHWGREANKAAITGTPNMTRMSHHISRIHSILFADKKKKALHLRAECGRQAGLGGSQATACFGFRLVVLDSITTMIYTFTSSHSYSYCSRRRCDRGEMSPTRLSRPFTRPHGRGRVQGKRGNHTHPPSIPAAFEGPEVQVRPPWSLLILQGERRACINRPSLSRQLLGRQVLPVGH
jgi:hypothetical protein